MASGTLSTQKHDHHSHDWDSPDYVAKCAEGQDSKEANRRQAFNLMADILPSRTAHRKSNQKAAQRRL